MFQQELGVSLSGGSAVLASKMKGKNAAQNATGSKADKQGGTAGNAATGHGHAAIKKQNDPTGINPLINHEAARMRLLFSQHPRGAVSPTSYPGEFTLKLLSGLAEITREHLIQSASSGGGGTHGGKHSGGSNGTAIGVESGKAVVDSFGRNRVMATPSLAIVNEWNQMQAGRSSLGVNNVLRHVVKKREAPSEKSASKKKSGANEHLLGNDAAQAKTGSAMKKKFGTGANNIAARTALVGGNGKRPIELLVLCYGVLAKCTFSTRISWCTVWRDRITSRCCCRSRKLWPRWLHLQTRVTKF